MKVLEKVKLHPYHMTVVQGLLLIDLDKCIHYYLWFQHLVRKHIQIFKIADKA